ncbi:hypothetical protein [Pseudoalteromonas phenolica]|uniref:hypothetical protein n=1 Tax=Pseudoalteromonas phenolica TaxID=161398 RepID=UPI00110B8D29|nr:hypothetical protein [Pseudoalteromonas phenolica]TMO54246.1 hypothetical protein CWC21_16190 [Pseudoalteromonas phenolica]
MNPYTKHHIERFIYKYISRTFSQDDVTLLLVLVRDYTEMGSVFRELGDFLAHPDKKDRGLVINNFKPIIKYFEENDRLVMSGADVNIKVPKGLGLLEEIQDSLNIVFNKIDFQLLPTSKNDFAFRDFIFCIIFLLGNFKLKIKNQLIELKVKYGHSLEVSISYESPILKGNFIELSVLSLHNVWIENHNGYSKELKSHIVRRFSNGLLGAIPYSLDLTELNKGMGEFPRGTVWPLPNL